MSPDLQTCARERGDTVHLFCEMVTAASQSLDLEIQDVTAISQTANGMTEELRIMISDLIAQGADRDLLHRLRSLLTA